MKGVRFSFIGGVSMLLVALLVMSGCDTATEKMQKKEESITAKSFERLSTVVPAPQLQDSLERRQLVERLLRISDPDKVFYIYLVNRGIIFAQLVLKGKVSSVNSKLTNTQQIIWKGSGAITAVESPALDGSYGSNGDAIFFFLTDGTYIEWNSTYLLSDRPFKLSQKPLLIGTVEGIN